MTANKNSFNFLGYMLKYIYESLIVKKLGSCSSISSKRRVIRRVSPTTVTLNIALFPSVSRIIFSISREGLVRLVKRTAVEELSDKMKEERESSNYLLRKALVDLNKKEKEIKRLINNALTISSRKPDGIEDVSDEAWKLMIFVYILPILFQYL